MIDRVFQMGEIYFAYGSNLWFEQMKARCPSAELIGLATLEKYRLCFPRRSPRWGGGVAGVEPDRMGKVEGVVYRMSSRDLLELDGYEGVAAGVYRRERVVVHTAEGAQEAWTYIPDPEDGAPFRPSNSYIGTMIRGALEQGLPGDWIRSLEGYRPGGGV